MSAGRTPGREIGLDDLSNARALREAYGISRVVTGPGLAPANATDILGDAAGAGDILNVLGTARVVDVVSGDDRVTVTAMDNQPDEGSPRRFVWTYTDAAGGDAVGTLTLNGFNSFGDPVQEVISFAAGTLTGTTAKFYSRVTSVVVRGAAALIDVAADSLQLRTSVHVGFGPVDPNLDLTGITRPGFIHCVWQIINTSGVAVQQTFESGNDQSPAANTYAIAAINSDGECSLLFNGADDWDGAFYYDIQFRYRRGQKV